MNRNTVYSLLAVLLLLGLLGLIVSAKKRNNNNPFIVDDSGVPAETLEISPVMSGDEANSIRLSTQQRPGGVISLSDVSVNEDAWGVVYAKNADGSRGAILGTEYFEAGSTPATITLDTDTVEGGDYIIQLYSDINAGDVFDPTVDLPLETESGQQIKAEIQATVFTQAIKG